MNIFHISFSLLVERLSFGVISSKSLYLQKGTKAQPNEKFFLLNVVSIKFPDTSLISEVWKRNVKWLSQRKY